MFVLLLFFKLYLSVIYSFLKLYFIIKKVKVYKGATGTGVGPDGIQSDHLSQWVGDIDCRQTCRASFLFSAVNPYIPPTPIFLETFPVFLSIDSYSPCKVGSTLCKPISLVLAD